MGRGGIEPPTLWLKGSRTSRSVGPRCGFIGLRVIADGRLWPRLPLCFGTRCNLLRSARRAVVRHESATRTSEIEPMRPLSDHDLCARWIIANGRTSVISLRRFLIIDVGNMGRDRDERGFQGLRRERGLDLSGLSCAPRKLQNVTRQRHRLRLPTPGQHSRCAHAHDRDGVRSGSRRSAERDNRPDLLRPARQVY